MAEHSVPQPVGGPRGGVGWGSPGRAWRGPRQRLQEPPRPKTEVQTAQRGAGEPQDSAPQQAGRALPARSVAPRLGAKACGTLLLSSRLPAAPVGKPVGTRWLVEPGQVFVQHPNCELTPQIPLRNLSSPSCAGDGEYLQPLKPVFACAPSCTSRAIPICSLAVSLYPFALPTDPRRALKGANHPASLRQSLIPGLSGFNSSPRGPPGSSSQPHHIPVQLHALRAHACFPSSLTPPGSWLAPLPNYSS